MTTIAREPLETSRGDPWPRLVARVRAWAASRDIELRDAIVLLPFGQHLPQLRRAWAAVGGWMPRIETTQTLARSLGPAPAAQPGQLTLDPVLDRLVARRLLRTAAGASAWARRDPHGFDHAVEAVMHTAHALARAAAAVPPKQREAHWRAGREQLGTGSGPGSAERLLARVALEWAAVAPAPITDALHALQPSAWVVLQAGGADRLAQVLLEASPAIPALWIDADPATDEPFAALASEADVTLGVCADFEDEAQRSAAHVLAALNDGHRPVALIAQDRLLVRRVRALLSRQSIAMHDETGWRLSTTRAAASLVALLRAAGRGANTDQWLDWLKSCASAWPGIAHGDSALQTLEGVLRHKGWVTPRAVDASALPERAAALWAAARQVVEPLAGARTQTLVAWLASLRTALEASGAWALLQADDAGRQVIAALHLAAPPGPLDGHGDALMLDELAAWVRAALEEASFVPEAPADADVVITPLERAMLRPFGAVVMPGADEKRLGAAAAPPPLLPEPVASALGVPTTATRRAAETLAFAHLLRLPRVTLLRRLDDGGEPLAPSPLVERLALAMRRAGRTLAAASDPREATGFAAAPVARPRPAAPDRLPASLSASACEALRACPYRFFALRMLKLGEVEELDDEVAKRDYGKWLHEVLHRFHLTRDTPLPAADEEARLHEVARAVQQAQQLDDPSFLPYAASFARIAPRYVEWLHARDRAGARWRAGEREVIITPPAWNGIEMKGIIDRIDELPGTAGSVTQLIDYKTSSSQRLRDQVADMQEDTQLAFYAALVANEAADIAAIYLPLDDSDTIRPIEHKDVAASASRLVDGIGRELERLRDGAALPALGEGAACTYCQARGLCRRDHWAAESDDTR